MMNLFKIGPDVGCWDLLALGRAGPYQLIVHHAHGELVEYFADVTAALHRQGEVEDLLNQARSEFQVSLDPRWMPTEQVVH